MMGQTFSEPVTEKETTCEQDKNFLVASSSIQGWRISMEDAHTIWLSLPDDEGTTFFAVYDGHGGAKVANYASKNLYKSIVASSLYQEGRVEEALKKVFVDFDQIMFKDEKMRDELAGSTAIVLMIKDSVIYCANIGDSRAVASFAGMVDPLSIDHKPTCPEEKSRVISAGGWVQFNRVNGNLALSRAFGDFVFKRNEKRSAVEQIVIAYPDVQTRTLNSHLEFIVLACDGVWDVMTNEEVVEFCRRRIVNRMSAVSICEELITRCLAPDCQMGSGIGCDNMTVILICYLNGGDYLQFCDRVASVSAGKKACKKQRRVRLNVEQIIINEHDQDGDGHRRDQDDNGNVIHEGSESESECNSSTSSFDVPMLFKTNDQENHVTTTTPTIISSHPHYQCSIQDDQMNNQIINGSLTTHDHDDVVTMVNNKTSNVVNNNSANDCNHHDLGSPLQH